jgi:hypothetical protein
LELLAACQPRHTVVLYVIHVEISPAREDVATCRRHSSTWREGSG